MEEGETLQAAAIRETAEETGYRISDVGPAVATQRFEWSFEGTTFDQEDTYFLVRTPGLAVSDRGWTDVEKATVVDHRWWTVEELRVTDEVVSPENLADLLQQLL